MGKIENGIVSVNAYGVLGDITFPLMFKIYKPKTTLAKTYYQQAFEAFSSKYLPGIPIEPIALANTIQDTDGTRVLLHHYFHITICQG